jgi:hypothetical protein
MATLEQVLGKRLNRGDTNTIAMYNQTIVDIMTRLYEHDAQIASIAIH